MSMSMAVHPPRGAVDELSFGNSETLKMDLIRSMGAGWGVGMDLTRWWTGWIYGDGESGGIGRNGGDGLYVRTGDGGVDGGVNRQTDGDLTMDLMSGESLGMRGKAIWL